MSNFRRRVFSSPALGSKQFPALLSDNNLRQAGFAQFNAVTGFVDPLTGLIINSNDDGMVIPVNAGPLLPLIIGEISELPFQAIWAPSLIGRRNFCSALFNFRALGFDPTVIADVPVGWLELYPWNGGVPGGISVEISWTGAAWAIRYYLGGGAVTTLALLANYVDCVANVIKINCTRISDTTKRFTITYYNSAGAGWTTSAPFDLIGAGLGDGIMVVDWAPCYAKQGVTSSARVAYCGMKNIVCQSTDIDHTAYTLPQM